MYCGLGSSGFADGACATARFSEPRGIAIIGTKMYIADSGTFLLRVIDMTTGTDHTTASSCLLPRRYLCSVLGLIIGGRCVARQKR